MRRSTRAGAPSGQLRVSVPVLFGRHCVAPVLLKLAQRHPGLRVEVAFSDRVVDLLEEGFDLAVRIGELADSASLAARRLGAQRMGICAAPSYLAARGCPATPDEIAGHAAIVYARAGEPVPWRVREANGATRELRLDSRLRFDDLQAIVDAAVAGAGLAWLPCWLMMPHVRAGELALVMDSERLLASDIHAVWPQTRYLAAKARAAIDALAAEIPPLVAYPLAETFSYAPSGTFATVIHGDIAEEVRRIKGQPRGAVR
jgi:DNA-binding transcriptional LysR family regulator